MAQDLGTGVSHVNDEQGYNYDLVVFQKGKPPLDTEVNLLQQLENSLRQRQTVSFPSGWVTYYPVYADRSLADSFYTQNPSGAKPEYALVNGTVINFTSTNTQAINANLIKLESPPTTGNVVDGVILEVWRALLAPNSTTNKPSAATVISSLNCAFMFDLNNGWICGDNGILIGTQNGGQTWSVLPINTKNKLNGNFFVTQTIGWVVGSGGLAARTASGGASWSILSTPVSENLNSVHAASQLIAWIVGDSGTILKTTNGLSWTSLTSGVTSNLRKVHFYDQLTGWVVGDSGTILKTTNGGSSWIHQTSGTTQNLNSVYFYDLNFGFAVGDSGTILRSSDGGASWVSQSGNITGGPTTENLHDVTMVPTLDREEVDEEVSSQLGATGTLFVVYHKPITKGDGNGTITNNPADITVTVNGTAALVDSVNGSTGAVLLHTAPGIGAVTKVTYSYREDSAVFMGRAWIVGGHGVVYYTDTIGAQWALQTSGTAYDLYSADFADQESGWICGANSVIKHTSSHGTTWTTQQSSTFVQEVQRVYYEGNISSTVFLNDDSIHPDVHIETSKRVQVQYKVRVISGVDPASNPEAGLSTATLGQGPNATGSYSYQNMGSVNGDYGCWRAKCPNTVDGYVYAIPMFFVNRRNTSSYDSQTNPNGSHQKGTAFIRPDLLTASNVVVADILDVRRRVVNPSITRFMTDYFDRLMANSLQTNFFRSSTGGDRYGVELLQVDRIVSGSSVGTLDDLLAGTISSEVVITNELTKVSAGNSVPTSAVLQHTSTTGIFHPSASHYKAIYYQGIYNGQPVPGYFTGFGTNEARFIFSSSAITKIQDPSLLSYQIFADWITPSTKALTYVPTDPKLVKNFSGSGAAPFFYQGVLDTEAYRLLESWDSGIPGYQNYSLVYSSTDGTDTVQQQKASTVELHIFLTVGTTGLTLPVNRAFYYQGDTQDIPYTIYTIRRINNITSGFSHRIAFVDTAATPMVVTAVSGYQFVQGQIVEVVAYATSVQGDTQVRNGATVNFNPFLKKIDRFVKSIKSTGTASSSTTITITNAEILGCSTTETSGSLNQPVWWVAGVMRQISVSGFGGDIITIADSGAVGTFEIQLLVRYEVNALDNPFNANGDGIEVAYNYIPPQCQSGLPSTLKVTPIAIPSVMEVSNLGSGGGTLGEPYLTPLQHIPVNDASITGDSIFNNKDPLVFANISVDTGFVQIPVIVPGSFNGTITLSLPSVDKSSRAFYSAASQEMAFTGEGLQFPVPRKVFIPVLVRVDDPGNTLFLHGEYLLVIMSRAEIPDRGNRTGYFTGGNCSISIYRIPNRPISRIS